MSRNARLVIPGIPHHVTQRGVRRMCIFDSEEDYRAYLRKLGQKAREYGLEILSWCLMPNHVHLVAVPGEKGSLSSAVGLGHWAYSLYFNEKHDAKGRLFQGRFFSTPLDEPHYHASIRYILQNPVRAHIVSSAWDYSWSSAAFHMHLVGSDPLVKAPDILGPDYNWESMLSLQVEEVETIRKCTQDGFPCGSEAFALRVAGECGMTLIRRPVGRPHKSSKQETTAKIVGVTN